MPIISAHPQRNTAATLLVNEPGAKLRDVQALSPREAVSLLTVRSTGGQKFAQRENASAEELRT